ncbi:MFS transporter [Apilactobacillus micheneri]|uniref:MFS transporter n=1 Tax=Apilactobacillus micheneri TaxID=1899430 RepID=A0A9Q8IPH2_9LACO|nr:MFS transporter [Apilactobacillus micheneri]TPR37212.1 MFS transporter [Apilactobacillus micheneri]TPR41171.1 MFS transporter [Apilactobacillus micheneri]TPR42752.1 MFS transporter [Apilactobacillus micheneri]TPR46278.1 MFS transporter [Apilactobacillus micheneri]TPR46963.1 MFS transporter [Apilactobacillus micheneri]
MKKRKGLGMKLIFMYSLLLNSGASFMWPLVTMYINDYLHKSLMVSGVSLLLMSSFMIIGNYVGGFLFDRWSAYKASMIGISISTFAILALIFFNGWPTFAILLLFLGFGDGINLTLLNSYATTVKDRDVRSVFNLLYIGLNLGVVIGTAMVGYLLKYGVATVFIAAGIFYVALWLMTFFYFNVDFNDSQSLPADKKQPVKTVEHSKINLIYPICMMVFGVYLSYTLWESVMSVHMVNMGISFESYSSLWTVNGLMIVIGQPLINYLSKKTKIKISTQVFIGILIFAISFYGLIFVKSYTGFLLIMVFLTFGEMIGLPDVPAWIDQLSSKSEKGKYQGVFNALMSAGRAISPLYGGLFVEYLGYNPLFIFTATVIMVTWLIVIYKNKKSA